MTEKVCKEVGCNAGCWGTNDYCLKHLMWGAEMKRICPMSPAWNERKGEK